MKPISTTARRGLRVLAAASLVLVLGACERPGMDSVQRGYRGTGMVQVYNPRILADNLSRHEVPPSLPAGDPSGPKAGKLYQNVKVLGDLSVGEFTRLMVSMSSWVGGAEGCNYCHNPANFADDGKYAKVVARRMIEMTRHINSDWKAHVADTGVTCYTCHRGQPVPPVVWHKANHQPYGANFMGDKAGQNDPSPVTRLASLPNDPFTPFLLGDQPIRVNGNTALPTGNRSSIKQAEFTYGLMTHFSTALGVNCTYCHNTQSFSKWEGSPPQRITAWHGIRMARDLNNGYLEPLAPVYPETRLGVLGDAPKLNCATCHQGAYKPLNGTPMLKEHPELAGPPPKQAAAAATTTVASK